jgi:tetratricopeptide (TPR) repeat protein
MAASRFSKAPAGWPPRQRFSLWRTLAALLSVLLLLWGAPAHASEQSELLSARGLLAFHKGQYHEALPLFDQAVQADARDPYALYYRGVTQARLENYPAAVTDLRAAMALKPNLDQGALELGIALVQTDQYKAAVPWLEQAQRAAPQSADASFFLGIAQLRVGEIDQARTNFTHAIDQDPKLAVPSRYYLGVTEYQAHNPAAAQEHFDAVIASSPDSEMGREANAFLTKMHQGAPAAQPAVLSRPYQLYGSVGFQYDSNLQLASDEAVTQQLGAKEEDGRAVLTAGAAYAPWRTEHAQLSLGYEFFQSLHFQYNQFNLQDQRGTVQFLSDAGPVQLGILGRYDFYLLQTTSLMQQATVTPWMTVPEENLGRTEVYCRVRRRDFLNRTFSFPGTLPVNFSGVQDSWNYAPGIRQFLYLGSPDRYVVSGYRFDSEQAINPEGNVFAYEGHELDAGVGWTLPANIAAELDYGYHRERYAAAANGRRDEIHQLAFAATKPLNDYLDVTLAYFGLFDNSNNAVFAYDRSIVSLSVGVRY